MNFSNQINFIKKNIYIKCYFIKDLNPLGMESFILRRDFKTSAAFLASGHVLHAKDSNNGFLALETRLVLNHFDGALVEYCG